MRDRNLFENCILEPGRLKNRMRAGEKETIQPWAYVVLSGRFPTKGEVKQSQEVGRRPFDGRRDLLRPGERGEKNRERESDFGRGWKQGVRAKAANGQEKRGDKRFCKKGSSDNCAVNCQENRIGNRVLSEMLPGFRIGICCDMNRWRVSEKRHWG